MKPLLSLFVVAVGALFPAGCQPHIHLHFESRPIVVSSQPEDDIAETPSEVLEDALKGVNHERYTE